MYNIILCLRLKNINTGDTGNISRFLVQFSKTVNPENHFV